MTTTTRCFTLLAFTFLVGCGVVEISDPGPASSSVDADSQDNALGAAPTDPVLGVPAVPTTGVNGSRPARTSPTWLACISKTTATCSTGSGGVGDPCGTGTLCNTDLFCIGGVCVPPVGLGGVCTANFQCGRWGLEQLTCVQGVCARKSTNLGPCDDLTDCQLPAGFGSPVCVARICREQGDVGAPCEIQSHCKTSSAAGLPLTCIVASGQTVGTCQSVSGPGGPCIDELNCNQSTAPRCIPLPTGRTCWPLAGERGGDCDDKADCDQSISPGGQECIAGICQFKGTVGTSCNLNTECFSPLVCINKFCRIQSTTGGTCDELSDCNQTQAHGCLGGICRLSGVLDGPCGVGNHCGSNTGCSTTSNSTGVMFCIGGLCKCPAQGTCFENANCPNTATGQQQVCIPRFTPELGNQCQPPPLNSPSGCCDEKADCRPINGSTCLFSAKGQCNSGGQCVLGKSQGTPCATSDECTGALICKINPLVPGRTYTTCEG